MTLSQEPQARERSPHGAAQVERGFSAAFELVATPALFALIGWFIDQRLGTSPIFLIGLTTFVAGYEIWKLCYNYTAQMTKLESSLISARTSGPAALAAEADVEVETDVDVDVDVEVAVEADPDAVADTRADA